MGLLKDFLSYRKFAASCGNFAKENDDDLKQLRGYRVARLEKLVYDRCKRGLFKEFTSGNVSQQFASGYMAALATHRAITSTRVEVDTE